MLNTAIYDPWQRSLFSRQQTAGKEPLLAGKVRMGKRIERLRLKLNLQMHDFRNTSFTFLSGPLQEFSSGLLQKESS